MSEKSFLYQRLSTEARFDTEAQGNWEMAYPLNKDTFYTPPPPSVSVLTGFDRTCHCVQLDGAPGRVL